MMKKLVCIILLFSLAAALFSCSDEIEVDVDAFTETEEGGTTAAAPSGKPVDFGPVDGIIDTEKETEPATVVTEGTADTADTAPAVVDTTEAVTEEAVTNPPQNDTPPAPSSDSLSDDPYIKRITFLGDSTTYGLRYYGIVPESQVWTPKSGTLALFRATTDYIYDPNTGGEYPVAQMCSMYHPDILLITLGINGIYNMKEESFKSDYTNLINVIKEASPSTHIILQTMYPMAASRDTSDGITHEKVAAGNVWIGEIAASCGVGFMNSAPALVNASGFRPEEWQNGDGLHLSVAGFNYVLDYIRNHPIY